MLEILDSIIATAAVVLGLSLIVQAVQQIIKQSFDLKSGYMKNELLALFGGTPEKATLLSGLKPVKALASQATSFGERVVKELEEATRGLGFADVDLLENVSKEKFVQILKSVPLAGDKSVQSEFENAVKDAEHWFDFTRKAFQDHYERRMKYWAFALSAAVVLILNANLLDVYREFSHNKPLRDTAVKMGEEFTSMSRDSLVVRSADGRKDTTFVVAKPDSQIAKEIKATAAGIQKMLDEESFQIMGWTNARLARYAGMSPYQAGVEMIIGWLGMALLVSLGAPFWYDFLKTVMGVKKLIADKGESSGSAKTK
jgi:hypothetical protein